MALFLKNESQGEPGGVSPRTLRSPICVSSSIKESECLRIPAHPVNARTVAERRRESYNSLNVQDFLTSIFNRFVAASFEFPWDRLCFTLIFWLNLGSTQF